MYPDVNVEDEIDLHIISFSPAKIDSFDTHTVLNTLQPIGASAAEIIDKPVTQMTNATEQDALSSEMTPVSFLEDIGNQKFMRTECAESTTEVALVKDELRDVMSTVAILEGIGTSRDFISGSADPADQATVITDDLGGDIKAVSIIDEGIETDIRQGTRTVKTEPSDTMMYLSEQQENKAEIWTYHCLPGYGAVVKDEPMDPYVVEEVDAYDETSDVVMALPELIKNEGETEYCGPDTVAAVVKDEPMDDHIVDVKDELMDGMKSACQLEGSGTDLMALKRLAETGCGALTADVKNVSGIQENSLAPLSDHVNFLTTDNKADGTSYIAWQQTFNDISSASRLNETSRENICCLSMPDDFDKQPSWQQTCINLTTHGVSAEFANVICDNTGTRTIEESRREASKQSGSSVINDAAAGMTFSSVGVSKEVVEGSTSFQYLRTSMREGNAELTDVCEEDKLDTRTKSLGEGVEGYSVHSENKKDCVCNYCGKTFPGNAYIHKHVQIHTGEKPYDCDQCGRCFRQKSSLRTHVLTHFKKKPFKCKFCGYRLLSRGFLKAHLRKHTRETGYNCATCGQHFDKFAHLSQHKRETDTCKTRKTWPCRQCKMTFDVKQEHSNHCRTHNVCDICGRTFTAKYNLQNHRMAFHEKERCPRCDKRLADPSAIAAHLAKGCKYSTYICSYCSLVFRRKMYASKHLLTHSVQLMYECWHCRDVRFHDSGQIVAHVMQSHSRDQALSCSSCSFTARRSIVMIISHIALTHAPVFKCSQCSVLKDSEKWLGNGYKTRHLDSFSCCQCGVMLVNEALLDTHCLLEGNNSQQGP